METYATERELFELAVALSPAERNSWLKIHCQDETKRSLVTRLLEADESASSSVSARPFEKLLEDMGDADEFSPSRIGTFSILERIGEGGASVVYRAEREQEGVKQVVALKLIRRTLYTPEEHRRFREERQALAQLRHSGIVKLIEGGITETGIPYIALELIEGEPITAYVRSHSLDIPSRLRLFHDVCRAVEAAHRALIVHRDLKPSNVLVTSDGIPKLLDFGIAKRLDIGEEETDTVHSALTPAYAAPEQFSHGPVTTATDVYALGILLEEMITGVRRQREGHRPPSQKITKQADPDQSPESPKVMRSLLRGGFDNIVLKATAQNPEDRYSSAGMLADDIERYIKQEPVNAHAPSAYYRTRMFVRRHRGGVMVAVALASAVICTLAAAIWEAKVARLESEHALREAARADTMRNFMSSAFAQAQPSLPREGPPRITEVVQQAIVKARNDKLMSVDARTELLTQLGNVLKNQSDLGSAQETLEWNFDQARNLFGDQAQLTLRAGWRLAQVLILSGKYHEAQTLLDSLYESAPESDKTIRAEVLLEEAILSSKQRDFTRAIKTAEMGSLLARETDDPDVQTDSASVTGVVRLSAGDLPGAAANFEELITLRERQYGSESIDLATDRANLARVLRRMGRLDDAEREIRRALSIDDKILPKDDYRRAFHLNALMVIERDKREYGEALRAAKEALRINRLAYEVGHPEIANNLYGLGLIELLMEDYEPASRSLRESLDMYAAKLGAEQFDTATSRLIYGEAIARLGNTNQGETEIRHAIASLAGEDKPDFDAVARGYEILTRVELDKQAVDEAKNSIDQIEIGLAKIPSPSPYWRGRVATLQALVKIEAGHPAEASVLLAAANDELANSDEPDSILMTEVPLLRARAERQLGNLTASRLFATVGGARLAQLRFAPSRLTRELDSL